MNASGQERCEVVAGDGDRSSARVGHRLCSERVSAIIRGSEALLPHLGPVCRGETSDGNRHRSPVN